MDEQLSKILETCINEHYNDSVRGVTIIYI